MIGELGLVNTSRSGQVRLFLGGEETSSALMHGDAINISASDVIQTFLPHITGLFSSQLQHLHHKPGLDGNRREICECRIHSIRNQSVNADNQNGAPGEPTASVSSPLPKQRDKPGLQHAQKQTVTSFPGQDSNSRHEISSCCSDMKYLRKLKVEKDCRVGSMQEQSMW